MADAMTEFIVVSPDSDSESISSTATLVPELKRREGEGGREGGREGGKEGEGGREGGRGREGRREREGGKEREGEGGRVSKGRGWANNMQRAK